MTQVAIVGGGWAGLACAVELAGAGVPVTLYEAARQLGGRARRVDWNGLAVDNGQHLMVGAYRATLGLLDRLATRQGVAQRPLVLDLPDFHLALPRLPAPLNLAWGLARCRGLGWRDKLAAARLMNVLRETGFRLPRDEGAGRFLARQQQPASLIDKLWGPLCVAALNTPLASASAQVFCHVLRDSLAGDRADSDLVLNRADLGKLLPDAAQAYLARHGGRVRLGTKVERIARRNGAWFLAGPDEAADRVVLATHATRVPELLADLPELAAVVRQVSTMDWQPILTLWLRFARTPRFPLPLLGLGGDQDPWAFQRDDLAAGLVSLVTSARGPHLDLAPAALQSHYLDLLARRLGPLPPLLDSLRIVEKRATFSCTPGLARPDNVTALRGLYLAGDYTAGDYPATLEGAVRSGLQCATLLQQGA
ncbi:MAG: hydroxysqualene dehydroxylase HpnE [Pseudomonadota bacterium]